MNKNRLGVKYFRIVAAPGVAATRRGAFPPAPSTISEAGRAHGKAPMLTKNRLGKLQTESVGGSFFRRVAEKSREDRLRRELELPAGTDVRLERFLKEFQLAGGDRTVLLRVVRYLAESTNPGLWKWPKRPDVRDFDGSVDALKHLDDCASLVRKLLRKPIFEPSKSADSGARIRLLPQTLKSYRNFLATQLRAAQHCYDHEMDPEQVFALGAYARQYLGRRPWAELAALIKAVGGKTTAEALRKAYNREKDKELHAISELARKP